MFRWRLMFLASFMTLFSGLQVAAAQLPNPVRVGAFAIDVTEVTIGQFRAFARATSLTTAAEREGGGFEYTGGWTRQPGWDFARPQGQPGADNEPAVHVSWSEADAFCRHAGGRLPTLAEWRSAAFTEQRGSPTDGFVTGRTYAYPVGDDPAGMNNNRRSHVAVGTTKRGVNGLFDMGANAWEWMADRPRRRGPDRRRVLVVRARTSAGRGCTVESRELLCRLHRLSLRV